VSYTGDVKNGLIGRATACAPGTCGELAQGLLDGEHFHITCPIDLYVTAIVELMAGPGRAIGPEDRPKALRGAEVTLDYLGEKGAYARLRLESPLPPGKGMASSTADVAATVFATALALGVHVTPGQVASLALRVEPSDGLMFPGIAMFDHRQGRALKLLGRAPAMRVLVLDFGGTVDTLAFNSVDRRAELQRLEPHWEEAAALITEGISQGNAALVGKGATVSALTHQQILPKPQLGSVLAFAHQVGAVGVNVAHSGTVLGILFADDPERVAYVATRVQSRLAGIEAMRCHRLVGGGIIPVPRETLDSRCGSMGVG